ncbi:MAG: glycosyltransferase [Candidatus Magnetoglobus multicellularis str. Araruama]|uniref:Glycosyltransferase n=1 Tax=Candidatus Magnetoglobus multicellularis str. Araruama TaxID=890399 RepID=A0A1V1PH12_9BACT|nr:MAG: glycosyltransferase [Candidatus Magnetoglobus multicellularis str. Araruama]
MDLSIIIPVYNESENLPVLYERLNDEMSQTDYRYEIIFINDGSTDSSQNILEDFAKSDKHIKVIRFVRNFGQTAALMAGFDHSSGKIVVSMDADLQNNPADIPALISEINKGYDVCSGWRKHRKDSRFWRIYPSKIANLLISVLSGVKLHDYGCTLKAYRSNIIKGIRLYGEMHRFIPIYAHWEGATITEIPVSHLPRMRGKSKYGIERTFKVILDLLVLISFVTIFNKPIYIFGGFGIINMGLSIATFFGMLYFKFFGGKSFIETPLPLLVVLFFLMGFISILMGFIAEILMRTYYESQNKTIYDIKKTWNID